MPKKNSKKSRSKATARSALIASTKFDGVTHDLVDDAFREAVKKNLVQCFESSITDNLKSAGDETAVQRFMNGLVKYSETRKKLLEVLGEMD